MNQTNEYARMLMTQLRCQLKEPHFSANDMAGTPLADLFVRASLAGEAPAHVVAPEQLEEAAYRLQALGLCIVGTLRLPEPILAAALTQKGQDAADDEINELLFPLAS